MVWEEEWQESEEKGQGKELARLQISNGREHEYAPLQPQVVSDDAPLHQAKCHQEDAVCRQLHRLQIARCRNKPHETFRKYREGAHRTMDDPKEYH